jgi:hypothetical protein
VKNQKACLTALWATAVAVALPDAAAREWTVDANGCKVWSTQPASNEAVEWRGACVDGFAEGKGQLRWTVKDQPTRTYEGDMKAGRRSGQGVQTEASGLRYEGGFRDDFFAGPGSLRHPIGASSRGTFVVGRLEGACTLIWPDGTRYEGACESGREEGKGRIDFTNGDRFAGTMRSGHLAGQGHYHWARGDVYEGGFADGKPAGFGIYRFADGSHYEGDFYDGIPSGNGRLELADGIGYEGSFVAGRLASPGTFFRAGMAAPKDSPQLRKKLNPPYAKPMTYRAGSQLASLNFASTDPLPPRPVRMTTVAAPAPPRPVRVVSAASFCSQMGRPDVPPVNWAGTAQLRVVAETHGGRARVVSVQSTLTPPNGVAESKFVDAVKKVVNETYVCSGQHMFEQDFQFVVQ